MKFEKNFTIFLCCEDIDHTRKRSKVEPSDGHISTVTCKENSFRNNQWFSATFPYAIRK